MSVFTPTHRSLDQIFEPGATYLIPAYQRPYSWESLGKSDQNNQVNRMWDDLWGFFEESPPDKEYFLGSMVIIARGLRTSEVIDGQQRLTTVSLLFAAMRCFLRGVGGQTNIDNMRQFVEQAITRIEQILYNQVGISLVRELKVKIQRESGHDFDAILKAAINCEACPKIEDPQHAAVAARYFRNRDFLLARLKERFIGPAGFTANEANRFSEFFQFLNTRVSLVLIATSDFDTAYSIFEIMNNRGLPLGGLDLLRNLVIRELDAVRRPGAGAPDAWLKLEEAGISEDFMGRWVESRKAAQLRSSAFNDAVSLYRSDVFAPGPGETRIEAFYGALLTDLRYYAGIVAPEDVLDSVAIGNKIRALQAFRNERYTRNLLLALFRYYRYDGTGAPPGMIEFLTAYQRWLLHIVLAPGVYLSNAPIYQAIRGLHDGDVKRAAAAFDLSELQRANIIQILNGPILDNFTARLLLILYVLHHQTSREDVVTQHLDIERVTLEHIIPQQPAPGTNWLVDFSPELRKTWTYRLGNMTLLTQSRNSSARNFSFADKRKRYKMTLLPLTQELAAQATISPEFIEQRHQMIVTGILEDLGWSTGSESPSM